VVLKKEKLEKLLATTLRMEDNYLISSEGLFLAVKKELEYFKKVKTMIQNNIEKILKENTLIPVATINNLSQVDEFYTILKTQGINCIEITLRTKISWEAIELFKQKYGNHFKIGVGTIITSEDILKCVKLNVDFMVSPGLSNSLIDQFNSNKIPFLPGVSSPSEIIRLIDLGWKYFKFFPADLFGGVKALKTYNSLFKDVSFCPTGGIKEKNHREYLKLDNVLSVGGSWLLDK
jgi:2-dehydro-3-deoxyphosphogluconate aldolase/(4S)-4-hydroxy-2-oxoglutarate aldolase